MQRCVSVTNGWMHVVIDELDIHPSNGAGSSEFEKVKSAMEAFDRSDESINGTVPHRVQHLTLACARWTSCSSITVVIMRGIHKQAKRKSEPSPRPAIRTITFDKELQ